MVVKSAGTYYAEISDSISGCTGVSNSVSTTIANCPFLYAPEGINLPGAWNSWTNAPTNKPNFASSTQVNGGGVKLINIGTRRYHTTFHIDSTNAADTSAGNYSFLFTSGPSSNYWKNKWNNVNVVIDSLQNYTLNGANDNSMSVSNGKWYTVNFEDKGYANTRAIFMETSLEPSIIDSVKQSLYSVYYNNPVAISFVLNQTPASEEQFYIRYSNDHWNSSTLIKANLSGQRGYAVIPPTNKIDTISYYIFSSTKTNINADHDLYTINLNNNNQQNYSYASQNQKITIDGLSQYILCSGSKIDINYRSGSFNANNTFTVQLSDSTGSFKNPIDIYTFADSISGKVNVTIPNKTLTGKHYRVRINGNSPSVTGLPNDSDITIIQSPDDSVYVSGNTTICNGDSVKLSVVSNNTYNYQWYENGNQINNTDSFIWVSTGGEYYVEMNDPFNCKSKSQKVKITVNNNKPIASIKALSSTKFCVGDSVKLVALFDKSYSYQWRFNFANIQGAIDTVITAFNSGSYEVVATNGCGSVTSNPVVVDANPYPAISISGKDSFCLFGSTDLTASFDSSYLYQWFRNDSLLTGS
ncbi:MAG: hypothetical protein HYZ42_17205, partial [Bacteroidetes bacterium]|nr:hypothetical protein [Bacteroidota bacterium]